MNQKSKKDQLTLEARQEGNRGDYVDKINKLMLMAMVAEFVILSDRNLKIKVPEVKEEVK